MRVHVRRRPAVFSGRAPAGRPSRRPVTTRSIFYMAPRSRDRVTITDCLSTRRPRRWPGDGMVPLRAPVVEQLGSRRRSGQQAKRSGPDLGGD